MGVTGNTGGFSLIPAGGGRGIAPYGEEVFFQGTRGTGLPGHWVRPLPGAEGCGSKSACADLDSPKRYRL
ncbi:hypothetical protein J2W49_004628 [Hydrogenophaga palleronii]|uniref:Uncharacterized protein n=1 Tax=Hydrogenophaga palleronii TaxID=65655 RepID=A0ABU1WTN5_9BURK|nr:hypothetical protein [Hydrogenophaga palleronii]